MISIEGVSTIKKNFPEAIPLDENAKYLKRGKSTLYLSAIAQESKIPDVKIEGGENGKIIIRISFNNKEAKHKVKNKEK